MEVEQMMRKVEVADSTGVAMIHFHVPLVMAVVL